MFVWQSIMNASIKVALNLSVNYLGKKKKNLGQQQEEKNGEYE